MPHLNLDLFCMYLPCLSLSLLVWGPSAKQKQDGKAIINLPLMAVIEGMIENEHQFD